MTTYIVAIVPFPALDPSTVWWRLLGKDGGHTGPVLFDIKFPATAPFAWFLGEKGKTVHLHLSAISKAGVEGLPVMADVLMDLGAAPPMPAAVAANLMVEVVATP